MHSRPFRRQCSFLEFLVFFLNSQVTHKPNSKPSTESNFSLYSKLIYLNKDNSFINNKGLSTELWCNPTCTRKSSLKDPFSLKRPLTLNWLISTWNIKAFGIKLFEVINKVKITKQYAYFIFWILNRFFPAANKTLQFQILRE